MSQRTARVSEIVRKVVGTKLVELMPARTFTITAVDISPDLHYATIWLISLKAGDLTADIAELETLKPKLQAELSSQMKSKFTPLISFRLDQSYQHVNRIDELLDNIKH